MKSENESDIRSENLITENKNKYAGSLLLFVIACSRLGGGMFLSIHGPTLLTLATNVNSTTSQVSWLFSGRSVGLLAGGIATGYMMKKTNNMIAFCFSSLLLASVVIATPWITDLWLLVVVVMAGGVGFGYLDAGMQALILQCWGERKSRPLISGYHFSISIGAFLAPLIAQPFLAKDGNSTSDDVCPKGYEPTSNQTTTNPPTVTPQVNGHWYSNVVWAYMICGATLVVVAVMFLYLWWIDIETKVRSQHQDEVEQRPETDIKEAALLMSLICLYYFCCVAGESTYNSYIYSVSICSDLNFGVKEATNINSLFWLAFGLGRLSGVYFFKKFKPRTIILLDFFGTVISMVVMVIFGETSIPIAWAITFLYPYLQGTVYPGGVSWASQYINMSGKYIWIFSAGQAIGTMTLVPASGFIFDYNPFNVMYVVLGCSIVNSIAFLLMIFEGKRLSKRLGLFKNETSDMNDNNEKSRL